MIDTLAKVVTLLGNHRIAPGKLGSIAVAIGGIGAGNYGRARPTGELGQRAPVQHIRDTKGALLAEDPRQALLANTEARALAEEYESHAHKGKKPE
jgi:hypothetical protein